MDKNNPSQVLTQKEMQRLALVHVQAYVGACHCQSRTRHISQGANLFWLASQMGHKGPEMLFRHYGAYLEEYDGHTDKRALRLVEKPSKGAA